MVDIELLFPLLSGTGLFHTHFICYFKSVQSNAIRSSIILRLPILNDFTESRWPTRWIPTVTTTTSPTRDPQPRAGGAGASLPETIKGRLYIKWDAWHNKVCLFFLVARMHLNRKL